MKTQQIISPKLLEILACPKCKGNVESHNKGIVCRRCRLVYEVRDGIPVMLISEAKAFDAERDC